MVNDLDHSYTYSQVTKLDLVVKVHDLDDNEPEFSVLDRRLAKNISEYLEPNATVAILPIAHDRDTLPENTRVRYLMLPGLDGDNSAAETFALNETTGVITLRKELEVSQRSQYEIRVKATSRSKNVNMKPNDNDPSQLILKLFVVKDRLTIEFEQQNYQVTVKGGKRGDNSRGNAENENEDEFDDDDDDDDDNDDEIEHSHRMFDMKRRKVRSIMLEEEMLPPDGKKTTAIFFARAHLIKRKLNRALKFNIQMVKIIKYNQNAIIRLSNSLLRTYEIFSFF